MLLKLNIGSFDKAPQLELRDRLQSVAGLSVEREETKYPREFLPGTDKVPDPLFGRPVFILRVTGDSDLMAGVLPAPLADAVRNGLRSGRVSDRLWWAM